MRKSELVQCLKPVPRVTSEKMLMSVSSLIFEAIDSPRSLAAHILLKNREYAQLVNLEVDPNSYSSSHDFGDDYLVSKLLSKFPDFSHEDLNPESAAEKTFFKCEESCRLTNKKFKELVELPDLWEPTMHRIFRIARRKISTVLGTPDLERISRSFGWGPGATSVAKGNHTSAYVKFAQRLDVTSNSLIMGHCCVNSIPSWVNCQLQTDEFPSVEVSLTREAFNVVRGNQIVFVPKNAKTHRVIAIEPHVNSYLQKGFGAEIRRLLRIRAGVDLKDQSLNQRLAKLGSIHNELATIDLSGASDTIASQLVQWLLPADWFKLLDQTRSKQGHIQKDVTWIYYHKFSSMGNGYTFELESLIFWALCKACLEVNGGAQVMNVYGDDIIVPTEHYDSVAKVLEFAGFSLNASKSFSSGAFRESCGKDYFFGNDVRPIFFKESFSNVESLYKLANSIRRYSHRRNFNYGCDIRFRAVWLHVVSHLPTLFRDLKIPEGFGDVGLLSNFDEACPQSAGSLKKWAGWNGYVFKGLIRLPVKRVMRDEHAGYTATLSAVSKLPEISLDSSRKGVSLPLTAKLLDETFLSSLPLLGHHDLRAMTYPKITRIHTHGWCDLGPWN